MNEGLVGCSWKIGDMFNVTVQHNHCPVRMLSFLLHNITVLLSGLFNTSISFLIFFYTSRNPRYSLVHIRLEVKLLVLDMDWL